MSRAIDSNARQRGWSLFETMVAVGLVASGLLVVLQQLSIGFRESGANDYRAFAYQKAAAMLAEIQNGISLGQISRGVELQALADRAPQPVLTTRRDAEDLPFLPDHPMSGNVQRRGQWLWARRIDVEAAAESGLWLCRVTMLRRDDNQQLHTEAVQALEFSLLPEPDAAEQVHDVFVLACGAAPSLAGDLAELRAHYENAASTIRRQSQAEVRLHWITRLGYGRDPCYAPYVNTAAAAEAAAPYAYWLPGRIDDAGGMLYRPELLGGLCRTEAGLFGAPAANLPWPVAIADRNNHCLRTPTARALFEQRVAAGLENGNEPPLQLLLDDLAQHPERFRNAVFVNLHGSALPMPPLRNYADAARDPEHFPGVRVVTHPARLQTPRDPDGNGNHADTQDLELRVYAYRTQGSGDVLSAPILVQIFGADLSGAVNAANSSATLLVHRLRGGIDPTTGHATGANRDYQGFDEVGGLAPTVGEHAFAMRYEAGFVPGPTCYTWLRLYNTPLCAPTVGTRGIGAGGQLYGLDYVPAAVDGTFAHDLAYDSAAPRMRNTARWRIRIPATAFTAGRLADRDQTLRIVTRIGGDTATGVRWPVPVQPLNASETFAWWSRSPSAVPVTERAQFLGDPRHCPYADLTATGGTLAHGYNWQFDNLKDAKADATSLWPGLAAARLQDGFGMGLHADAPRLLRLLREGMQSAGAVLVLPQGRPADALLLGGEIVATTSTGTAPALLHAAWSGGQATAIDTVHPGATTGARVLTLGINPSWWAKPWLGELFPDDQWAAWYAQGNLPGPGAAGLQWQLVHQAKLPSLPAGTAFDAPQGAVVGEAGSAMLFASGTRAATIGAPAVAEFRAQPTVALLEINTATNLVPPSSIPSTVALELPHSLGAAVPAFDFTDTYPRSTTSLLQTFWSGSGRAAGGVYACADAAARTAFFVPWTVSPGGLPNREAALQALLSGIRALHAAGTPGMAGRVLQLPRLEILAPQPGTSVSPEAVTLRWRTDWRRFDDQSYGSNYGSTFRESESELVYRILWSADEGVTWTSALTGRTTIAGTFPAADDCLRDTSTGTESYTLGAAIALPDGEHRLRIEAWRVDGQCHCSAQSVQVLVNHAAAPPRRNP